MGKNDRSEPAVPEDMGEKGNVDEIEVITNEKSSVDENDVYA